MTRRMGSLVIALALVAMAGALHATLIYSNYYALSSAFALQGYETKTIGEDELLGPLTTALGLEGASFAQVYGAILALVIGIGLVVLFRHLRRLIALLFDRAAYLRQQDTESAGAARVLAIRELIEVVLISIPMVLAANWDLKLFIFRQVVNQVADGSVDVTAIPGWAELVREQGTMLFMAPLMASVGGYLGCTAIACQLLESGLSKLSDAAKALGQEWNRLTGAEENREEALQGDSQPVSVAPELSTSSLRSSETAAESSVSSPQTPQSAPRATFVSRVAGRGPAEQAVSAPPSNPSMPEIPVTVERERETVEVYGAEPAVRVTVEEAVAQPDTYHVDGAGRVWSQEFWRSTNGSELAAVAASGGMR